jgi:hypothetical protein
MEALRLLIFVLGLAIFIGVPAWLVVKIAAWMLGYRSAPRPLNPESQFIVTLSDTTVTCRRPDRTEESIRWADLQKVEVYTTSDGPFLPDVFWVLHDTQGSCSIPQGASGEKELANRILGLPGFDEQEFIRSMGSTEEAVFTCWTRTVQSEVNVPSV